MVLSDEASIMAPDATIMNCLRSSLEDSFQAPVSMQIWRSART